MRILCLADDFPWPEKSGYKIRLGNVVRALAEAGELDLFVRMPFDHDGDTKVPDDAPMRRVEVVGGDPPCSTPRTLARWLRSGLPRMLARVRLVERATPSRRVGRVRATTSSGTATPTASWSSAEWSDAAAIVDLDNLEDQRIADLRVARAG